MATSTRKKENEKEEKMPVAMVARDGRRSLIMNVLCCVIWTTYLIAGSFLFVHLEYDNDMEEKREKRLDIHTKLHQIWALGVRAGRMHSQLHDNDNTTIIDDNGTTIIDEVIPKLPDDNDTSVIDDILSELSEDLGIDTIHTWNFCNSFHFCLSVVSTIGYGYLAPKTRFGRQVCIMYGVIGIPLNIVLMRKLGRINQSAVNFLYRRLTKVASLCCCVSTAKVHGQTTSAIQDGASGLVTEDQSDKRSRTTTRAAAWALQSSRPEHFRGIRESHPAEGLAMGTNDDIGIDRSTRYGLSQSAGVDARMSTVATITATSEQLSEEHIKKGNEEAYRGGDNRKVRSPLWFIFLIVFIHQNLCALLMKYIVTSDEGWSYLDCLYLIFQITSTVGFGDLEYVKYDMNGVAWMICDTAFTVCGLCMLSALFDAVTSAEKCLPSLGELTACTARFWSWLCRTKHRPENHQ
ncbi:uncharacterized protein [Diadema antillarum]|uniref:uncharacterized protein n=1 Tax=Diadema antillarum TaxID=105358 RepID=UPI003A8B7A83